MKLEDNVYCSARSVLWSIEVLCLLAQLAVDDYSEPRLWRLPLCVAVITYMVAPIPIPPSLPLSLLPKRGLKVRRVEAKAESSGPGTLHNRDITDSPKGPAAH